MTRRARIRSRDSRYHHFWLVHRKTYCDDRSIRACDRRRQAIRRRNKPRFLADEGSAPPMLWGPRLQMIGGSGDKRGGSAYLTARNVEALSIIRPVGPGCIAPYDVVSSRTFESRHSECIHSIRKCLVPRTLPNSLRQLLFYLALQAAPYRMVPGYRLLALWVTIVNGARIGSRRALDKKIR